MLLSRCCLDSGQGAQGGPTRRLTSCSTSMRGLETRSCSTGHWCREQTLIGRIGNMCVRICLSVDKSLLRLFFGWGCLQGQSSALHKACEKGDPDAINILLDFGADVQSKADVIHLFFLRMERIISDLFCFCAFEKGGETPLHSAAYNGQLQACIMLLQHPDINPNVKNKVGINP